MQHWAKMVKFTEIKIDLYIHGIFSNENTITAWPNHENLIRTYNRQKNGVLYFNSLRKSFI